jgi:hypothetical protein
LNNGKDFAADMSRMASAPKTQEWWKICDPCQTPLETRATGEWWGGHDGSVSLRLSTTQSHSVEEYLDEKILKSIGRSFQPITRFVVVI